MSCLVNCYLIEHKLQIVFCTSIWYFQIKSKINVYLSRSLWTVYNKCRNMVKNSPSQCRVYYAGIAIAGIYLGFPHGSDLSSLGIIWGVRVNVVLHVIFSIVPIITWLFKIIISAICITWHNSQVISIIKIYCRPCNPYALCY